jgi:hypothetical protein
MSADPWRRWLVAVALLASACAPSGTGGTGGADGADDGAPARAGLRFAEEEVFLTVEGDTLAVEGVYWFANDGDAQRVTGIVYPFPGAPEAEPPHEVTVEDEDGGAIAARPRGDAIVFPLTAGPHEVRRVTIRYRQRFAPGQMRYITTTALRWGRPLARALFEVTAPAELGGRTNLSGAEVRWRDDVVVWRREFAPYVPREDVIVRW